MQDLEELKGAAEQAIAASESLVELDDIRVQYLGKKGKLTALLKELGKLPATERPAAGQKINTVKKQVNGVLEQRKNTLAALALDQRLEQERIDISLPGRRMGTGGLHPVPMRRPGKLMSIRSSSKR